MNHYTYHIELKKIWNNACKSYQHGEREPSKMVSPDEIAYLESIGLNQQDLFDAVDDNQRYDGDPDFETFLLVSAVRRDYFIEKQQCKSSGNLIVVDDLPAKTDSVRGIEWLPRIYPKAVAKIRGELPPEIMYGCGGDRRFLKACNIHPADMLRAAWQFEDDKEAFYDWVVSKRG